MGRMVIHADWDSDGKILSGEIAVSYAGQPVSMIRLAGIPSSGLRSMIALSVQEVESAFNDDEGFLP